MKKSYRVKSEKDFQKIFEKSNSCANKNFIVYVLEKNEQPHFRVGISVGKRIGNAVIRNRMKRKIRQGLYEIRDLLKKECDFVVIARPGAQNLTLEEVKKNLIHVLKIAKIIQ